MKLKHQGSCKHCLACTKAIEVRFFTLHESHALATDRLKNIHDKAIAQQIKERRHLYLYTVILKPFPEEGPVPEVYVEAYNMEQVAHKLGKKLNNVLYVTKRILA